MMIKVMRMMMTMTVIVVVMMAVMKMMMMMMIMMMMTTILIASILHYIQSLLRYIALPSTQKKHENSYIDANRVKINC